MSENTNVTHNTLNASAGLAVEGGGVFTTFPITPKHSLIAKNQPPSLLSLSTMRPPLPPPAPAGLIQAETVSPALYRFARLVDALTPT